MTDSAVVVNREGGLVGGRNDVTEVHLIAMAWAGPTALAGNGLGAGRRLQLGAPLKPSLSMELHGWFDHSTNGEIARSDDTVTKRQLLRLENRLIPASDRRPYNRFQARPRVKAQRPVPSIARRRDGLFEADGAEGGEHPRGLADGGDGDGAVGIDPESPGEIGG